MELTKSYLADGTGFNSRMSRQKLAKSTRFDTKSDTKLGPGADCGGSVLVFQSGGVDAAVFTTRRVTGELLLGSSDFTGNRAAKLRKWSESHFRDGGSETMGAAKHGAMEKLRVISWKFCRG